MDDLAMTCSDFVNALKMLTCSEKQNFRISKIYAWGEFECRQVVFWGTGTKRLGTPGVEHILWCRL